MNLSDSGFRHTHVQQNLIWNPKDESQDVLLIECALRNNGHVSLLSPKESAAASFESYSYLWTCSHQVAMAFRSGLCCCGVQLTFVFVIQPPSMYSIFTDLAIPILDCIAHFSRSYIIEPRYWPETNCCFWFRFSYELEFQETSPSWCTSEVWPMSASISRLLPQCCADQFELIFSLSQMLHALNIYLNLGHSRGQY